ncbi:MAG: hypothetical protein Q4G26_08940 [Paracoccus sp. (in: a-proteobacteria)]|nr:hypothetical protein [Paracoccus sp. (in: a-proteobacteria)]
MEAAAESYLLAEIAEEGDLYISFAYLHNNFGWNSDAFKRALLCLMPEHIAGFYIYSDKNNPVGISLEEMDFGDANSLKGVNFLPA